MNERSKTDIGQAVSKGLEMLAHAITPLNTLPGKDAAGGRVESLTEAVMGVTAGMVMIADAINNLADAVRESDSE